MGFGSYDESEQDDGTDADLNEDEGVSVHEHEHEGDVTVEGADSTGELVDRLQDMK